MNKKKAFTVAEVLITLSVLGLVAMLLMASSVKNQKNQTVIRLKVAYSLLKELTNISKTENRGIPQNINTTKEEDWNKYVRPYIQIARDCGTNGVGCFAGEGGGWYNPNGVPYSTANNGYGTGSFHKVILKNGMSLAFQSCYSCLGAIRLFVVDIDGPKRGYSKLGQDVFVFEWQDPNRIPDLRCRNWVSHKPLSPELTPYAGSCLNRSEQFELNHQGGWYLEGWDNEIIENCRGETGGWRQVDNFFQQGVGTMCAAWIIRNDWKIPRNYPWNIVNQKPDGFRRP